jgi:hypothetical protein
LRLGRRRRAHRIGGALKGCRLVEYVPTHILTPFVGAINTSLTSPTLGKGLSGRALV